MSAGIRHGLLLLAACGGAPAQPDAAKSDSDAPAADARARTMLLGTTWTPLGYTSMPANFAPFYMDHSFGPIVAVHTAWRDDQAHAGQLPNLAAQVAAAQQPDGFTMMLGIGADTSNLTSDSEPNNATWTNAETRTKFCQVAVAWATAQHPAYMFLGNEMDGYYHAHPTDWPNWLSELASCTQQVHAASPQTIVFTTYQLELVKGKAEKTGRAVTPPDWTPVTDAESAVDAIGFTSYPYFEYAAPGDMPADYYSEIATHVSRPVVFSELGWVSDPAAPFGGSEQKQADFVDAFFTLSAPLHPAYAVWLWRYDIPIAIFPNPGHATFAGDGFFSETGTERAAAAHWRAHVVN